MSLYDIDEWLNNILSLDSTTFENAYWTDRPPVEEVIPKIIQALDIIFDTFSRCKLIELLGECGDLSVLPRLRPYNAVN